jgi:hypothetical protein
MAACLVAVEASKACSETTLSDTHEAYPTSADRFHVRQLGAISSPAQHADVAELVDARRSGRRARKGVEVRVLSSAFSEG